VLLVIEANGGGSISKGMIRGQLKGQSKILERKGLVIWGEVPKWFKE
jgi:hypothetical protein